MFGKLFKYVFYTALFVAFVSAILRYSFSISYLPFKIHTKYYKANNLAIDGYDVVKYFTERKSQRGMEFYFLKWDEFNWIFNTSGDMKTFNSKPQKYVPQFGGYDCYWITKNIAYPPDPKIFHLYRGKLYLFSSEENKSLFISDIEKSIAEASLNWNN
jgi:hypothetical protein